MRRIFLVVIPMLLALGNGSAVQADDHVSGAGLGLRLLEAPADRRDDPRAALSIVDHVAPGTTIDRRLQVTVDTVAATSVRLYVGSASVRGGQFVGDDGTGSGDIALWGTVDKPSITMPPRAEQEVRVRIQVPADASAGERYGVIWAEAAATRAGVTQANRIGVRVYLSVGPGGEPPSDFRVDQLVALRDEQRRPVVEARVRNTGGRALDMSGALRLSEGPGGLATGPLAIELGQTLAVGGSATVRAALDEALPAGPWLATLTLRSGTLERQATATITFPDEAGTSAAPVPAKNLPLREDPSVVIPVAAGLLGVALLLLLLLWRRRPKEEEDEPERDERLLEPAG